jgi:hypothetical protein
MRILWIALTVLFVAIGPPNAQADSYTATFTCSGTCTSTPSPTTATFAPSGPGSIGVFTWDDVSWGFAFPDNWLPSDSYTWFGFRDTTSGGETDFLTFRITDVTIFNLPNVPIDAFSVQRDSSCPSLQACQIGSDSGVLSFSPVATPESSSVVLLLAGIGFLLVIRKR